MTFVIKDRRRTVMKKVYDKELWEKEGIIVPLKAKRARKSKGNVEGKLPKHVGPKKIDRKNETHFRCLKCGLPDVIWDCPRCGYSHR